MIKSSNPALNNQIFQNALQASTESGIMTIQGTVNKTLTMTAILLLTGTFSWSQFSTTGNPAAVTPWLVTGMIIGLITALITIFKKTAAPVTAPIYAGAQGLVLGGISAIFEAQYPGIVLQATTLTAGTLLSLLFAYKSGMIRATENFKLGIVAATGGIFIVYMAAFILGFFGVSLPIFGNGLLGIGFSLFVCAIAALSLVMDFDFIERGAEIGAPKYMEWYAAFGLMVTLIWLYIEILRLLAKMRSRD
ncbi:MAG: Bax inhibitor-1/YccA family protein [bacterium]|nr:Bax inhibitor-1/YccA family protein [bacterium]